LVFIREKILDEFFTKKCGDSILVELEFEDVGFCGGDKT